MSREIKLRYLWKDKFYYIDFAKDNLEENFKEYELRNKTTKFDRFIGLKDKNGVEIYESDMMYVSGQGDSYVKYLNDVCCFVLLTCDEKLQLFATDEEDEIVMKIKGNIHQNKELLE